jgi:CBS domain-containing protein
MKVAELMRSEVTSVRMEDRVSDAVALLCDNHISAVPVVDRKGNVVGVFSTADLATAESEAGDEALRESLFERMPVRDVMTPYVLTVTPETDVREAAQQMLYANVHRLFVTRDDRLVGVISTTDIARAVALRWVA